MSQRYYSRKSVPKNNETREHARVRSPTDGSRKDALIDLFGRIENFFRRLEVYIEVPPTAGMTDIIVKIMVEFLSILAIATKEIKQSKASKVTPKYGLFLFTYCSSGTFLKKLVGRTDIEDALQRLEKLTQYEVRMAAAQGLKATQDIGDKVNAVNDKVMDISSEVWDIGSRLQEIDDRVRYVDDRVRGFDDKVTTFIEGAYIWFPEPLILTLAALTRVGGETRGAMQRTASDGGDLTRK